MANHMNKHHKHHWNHRMTECIKTTKYLVWGVDFVRPGFADVLFYIVWFFILSNIRKRHANRLLSFTCLFWRLFMVFLWFQFARYNVFMLIVGKPRTATWIDNLFASLGVLLSTFQIFLMIDQLNCMLFTALYEVLPDTIFAKPNLTGFTDKRLHSTVTQRAAQNILKRVINW